MCLYFLVDHFLKIDKTLINFESGKLILRVNGKEVKFDIMKSMQYPFDFHEINCIKDIQIEHYDCARMTLSTNDTLYLVLMNACDINDEE